MKDSFSSVTLLQDRNVATEHNSRRRLLSVFPMNESNSAIYWRRMQSAAESGDAAIMPLFQGMGTHYSFLYVGTPAQR